MDTRQIFLGLVQLCRPKQWVKNIFVFAPLIFAGLFLEISSISQTFAAFFLFCLASSATYILNDLKDIEKDRLHPTKSKTRPLAANIVQPKHARLLMIGIYIILGVAALLQPYVLLVIFSYLLLNFAYSHYLKSQPLLDIFTIALGFVLRVYAGAVAIEVPVSGWMFITTLCLALYLATIKRRQELVIHGAASRQTLQKYSLPLLNRYAEMSAISALMFYSIYVVSSKPTLIITIPIVIFGLFRYWYITDMLHEGESPTDALFSDIQLISTGVLWGIACIYGIWNY